MEDARNSTKSIANQLDISRERVGSIIHEDLDLRKLSAKWIPNCLNADQKRQRCQSSEQIWNFFGAIQMIACWERLVTMDEICIYQYDPETKQQSMEWGYSGSPRPKNSECKNLLEKFSPQFFWDQGFILLIDYLPKDQTNNAEYYSSLLVYFEGKTLLEVHQGDLVLA